MILFNEYLDSPYKTYKEQLYTYNEAKARAHGTGVSFDEPAPVLTHPRALDFLRRGRDSVPVLPGDASLVDPFLNEMRVMLPETCADPKLQRVSHGDLLHGP